MLQHRNLDVSDPTMMSIPDMPPTESSNNTGAVGAELRVARLRAGWTVKTVAAQLCLREAVVEALETGQDHMLPGRVYAAGFVRSYAKLVGLDAEMLVRRYRAGLAPEDSSPDLVFSAPVAERSVSATAAILLGVFLTGLVYAGWYQLTGGNGTVVDQVASVPDRLLPAQIAPTQATLSPQIASVAPATGSVAAPAANGITPSNATSSSATNPGQGGIAIRARLESWVQVRDRSTGSVLMSRVMKAGEGWDAPLGASLLLTTGNAGAIDVVLGGVVQPPLGGIGEVRRNMALDADLGTGLGTDAVSGASSSTRRAVSQ